MNSLFTNVLRGMATILAVLPNGQPLTVKRAGSDLSDLEALRSDVCRVGGDFQVSMSKLHVKEAPKSTGSHPSDC